MFMGDKLWTGSWKNTYPSSRKPTSFRHWQKSWKQHRPRCSRLRCASAVGEHGHASMHTCFSPHCFRWGEKQSSAPSNCEHVSSFVASSIRGRKAQHLESTMRVQVQCLCRRMLSSREVGPDRGEGDLCLHSTVSPIVSYYGPGRDDLGTKDGVFRHTFTR